MSDRAEKAIGRAWLITIDFQIIPEGDQVFTILEKRIIIGPVYLMGDFLHGEAFQIGRDTSPAYVRKCRAAFNDHSVKFRSIHETPPLHVQLTALLYVTETLKRNPHSDHTGKREWNNRRIFS